MGPWEERKCNGPNMSIGQASILMSFWVLTNLYLRGLKSNMQLYKIINATLGLY